MGGISTKPDIADQIHVRTMHKPFSKRNKMKLMIPGINLSPFNNSKCSSILRSTEDPENYFGK
jgi:hypothetical protein